MVFFLIDCKNLFILQVISTNQNHTFSLENFNDDNYILVDNLQKLTDEYVMDTNLSLTPKPIWRPFIESVFEGSITLDLDNQDKILIDDLEYLKNIALIFASLEEEALGIQFLIYHILKF